MNNVILFIIIMVMVLNLDYFSREEIQLPENHVGRGPKGQNIEVDDKQELCFFSPLLSRRG